MNAWLFLILWLGGTWLINAKYELYDRKTNRWAVSTKQNGPSFVLLMLLWAVLIALNFL